MKERKNRGRGSNTQDMWDSIKRGGGKAPSQKDLENIFQEDRGRLLSREELISRIVDYLLSISRVVAIEDGTEIREWIKSPSKNDLANAIGVSTQVLSDYCRGTMSNGKPYTDNPDVKRRVANEDFDIVKRALTIIEGYYEGTLGLNRNCSGSIFWLKNSNLNEWKDDNKTVIEHHRMTDALDASDLPKLGKMGQMPDMFIPSKVIDQEPAKIENQEVHGCDVE